MEVVANYAIEDDLSAAVVRRCLDHVGIHPGTPLGRRGCGWLKANAQALNQSAAGIPCVMLTDLDRNACPPGLVEQWLGATTRHPDFLLRVAVREVEAWLLADRRNFARFLGVAEANLPRDFESLDDPKLTLLLAARRSRNRRLREDIVAEAEHGPVQGPAYNDALGGFVTTRWDLVEAAKYCLSLDRMLTRLEDLQKRKDG